MKAAGMPTTIELNTTTKVDLLVHLMWQQWTDALEGRSPVAPEVAHSVLVKVAEAADQPLCTVWGRLCSTPHNLTLRSCCQTWVCESHEDEHDKHCTEFDAQLREEAL